jgi:predicted regulator of Ras-like GTPase activity (Roadblock/LC7/MglB family)
MAPLPQLLEEDIRQLDESLHELLARSDATTALVIDKGGFLLTKCGNQRQFDLTTIAALASGAYAANQTIAQLVRERNFNCIYQQGEHYSMLVMNVDENCLLVVIFRADVSVGAVKYYAVPVCARVAAQMKMAQQREPGVGLDLSMLNLSDPSEVFKKKV